MSDGGFFTLLFGGLGVLLFASIVIFMIRLWDLVTQASEYFARENERYRREYERRRAASE